MSVNMIIASFTLYSSISSCASDNEKLILPKDTFVSKLLLAKTFSRSSVNKLINACPLFQTERSYFRRIAFRQSYCRYYHCTFLEPRHPTSLFFSSLSFSTHIWAQQCIHWTCFISRLIDVSFVWSWPLDSRGFIWQNHTGLYCNLGSLHQFWAALRPCLMSIFRST